MKYEMVLKEWSSSLVLLVGALEVAGNSTLQAMQKYIALPYELAAFDLGEEVGGRSGKNATLFQSRKKHSKR
jgi:hypothetical protein